MSIDPDIQKIIQQQVAVDMPPDPVRAEIQAKMERLEKELKQAEKAYETAMQQFADFHEQKRLEEAKDVPKPVTVIPAPQVPVPVEKPKVNIADQEILKLPLGKYLRLGEIMILLGRRQQLCSTRIKQWMEEGRMFANLEPVGSKRRRYMRKF